MIKEKIKFYLARLPAVLSVLLLLYYLVIILRNFINFLVSNYSSIDVLLYDGFPILAPIAMAILLFSYILFSEPTEIRISFLSKDEFENLSYVYKEVKNTDGLHKLLSEYTTTFSQGTTSLRVIDENKKVLYEQQIDVFTRVEIEWKKPLSPSGLVGVVKNNCPKEIKYYDEDKLLYTLTIGADLRVKRITDNQTHKVLFLEGGRDDKEIQANEGVV